MLLDLGGTGVWVTGCAPQYSETAKPRKSVCFSNFERSLFERKTANPRRREGAERAKRFRINKLANPRNCGTRLALASASAKFPIGSKALGSREPPNGCKSVALSEANANTGSGRVSGPCYCEKCREANSIPRSVSRERHADTVTDGLLT